MLKKNLDKSNTMVMIGAGIAMFFGGMLYIYDMAATPKLGEKLLGFWFQHNAIILVIGSVAGLALLIAGQIKYMKAKRDLP